MLILFYKPSIILGKDLSSDLLYLKKKWQTVQWCYSMLFWLTGRCQLSFQFCQISLQHLSYKTQIKQVWIDFIRSPYTKGTRNKCVIIHRVMLMRNAKKVHMLRKSIPATVRQVNVSHFNGLMFITVLGF